MKREEVEEGGGGGGGGALGGTKVRREGGWNEREGGVKREEIPGDCERSGWGWGGEDKEGKRKGKRMKGSRKGTRGGGGREGGWRSTKGSQPKGR